MKLSIKKQKTKKQNTKHLVIAVKDLGITLLRVNCLVITITYLVIKRKDLYTIVRFIILLSLYVKYITLRIH